MNPTKRFFLILAAVSLAVWIAGNVLLGPVGLSAEYRESHKAEHERYIEIIKSSGFKLYEQRPELNAEALPAENVTFVEEYRANPAFIEEQHRIHLYDLFFDFFNAALVLIIAVRFGRKPIVNLLDTKIAELRERMESAAKAGQEAQERREHAEDLLNKFPEEEKRIQEQTDARIERELAQLAEANRNSLKLMAQELADRKEQEVRAAAMLVKRELADQAIDQLAQQYRETLSEERETVLIDRFASDLEKQA